jgi:DNA-binding NtrC family response regulator
MGQASAFVPIALVVEDDEMQREMVAMLLEESEMGVIQCENADAALSVLKKMGALVAIMFTDVNLTGEIDGVQLAHFAHQHYPNIHVIVTSGVELTKQLPEGTTFMPKPWVALELLREAVRSQH